MDKSENDENALLRIAQAIGDGDPVDRNALSAADEVVQGKLQQLLRLEAVAVAHRAAQRRPTGPREPSSEPLESTRTLEVPSGGTPAARPTSVWGPLKILEVMGRGGFGEVYRAYDPSLQREVALKLLRPDRSRGDKASQAFLDEARRLARVRHPNVVTVHGADQHEGRVGLWTDLVRGKNLEEYLAQQGPLGAQEAVPIGLDLCRALAAVHAASLVHRDVKASNVMREQGGRILLMDFGSVADRDTAQVRNRDESISGTPLYMAPELLCGKPPAPSSDIYSLGVLLYHLVSNRLPVEASSIPDLLDRHQRGDRTPLRDVRPDLPGAFVQVVERALAVEPKDRYPSAGAMEQALAASAGPVIQEPGARLSRGGDRKPRRWRTTSLAAAILLAVLGAFVVFRPSASGRFRAEAELYRLGNGTEERLRPGSRVTPGDRLFLELETTQPVYAYVLNEDEMGTAFVLFPAGLDLENPLASGIRHRLPGRENGSQMTWEVTSIGGKEHFLVIASREPIRELEQDIARLPRAQRGRQVAYAPVSPESMQTLRGVGGLVPAVPASPATSGEQLAGIAKNLSAQAERSRGIWTWLLDLENPAP